MTDRPVEVGRWPIELEDAGDSGALTLVVDAPPGLPVAESWIPGATSTLPPDAALERAYGRFTDVVDACGAVHKEVDAVFGALRDLQPITADHNTTAALQRLNGAWLRLDTEILHLSQIAPRCLDAVSSMTSDLYEVLRQFLSLGLVFQGGTPAQFKAEADTLASRLAEHDRYTIAQQESPL